MKTGVCGKMIVAVMAVTLWVFGFGCGGSEPTPRDGFTGAGGLSAGGGAGGNQEEDEGEDEDEDGEGEDEDGEGEFCELEPRESDVPLQPCCFVDEDCWSSEAPDAELMRCYRSECREGGEGVCRYKPVDTNECWSDEDCERGQFCQGAILGSCLDQIFEGDRPGFCR